MKKVKYAFVSLVSLLALSGCNNASSNDLTLSITNTDCVQSFSINTKITVEESDPTETQYVAQLVLANKSGSSHTFNASDFKMTKGDATYTGVSFYTMAGKTQVVSDSVTTITYTLTHEDTRDMASSDKESSAKLFYVAFNVSEAVSDFTITYDGADLVSEEASKIFDDSYKIANHEGLYGYLQKTTLQEFKSYTKTTTVTETKDYTGDKYYIAEIKYINVSADTLQFAIGDFKMKSSGSEYAGKTFLTATYGTAGESYYEEEYEYASPNTSSSIMVAFDATVVPSEVYYKNSKI